MTQHQIQDWVENLHIGDAVAIHEAPTEPERMFVTGPFCFNGYIANEVTGFWCVRQSGMEGFIRVGKGTAWGAGGVCIRPFGGDSPSGPVAQMESGVGK